MGDQLKCPDCGKPISAYSKSGLCGSCAAKARDSQKNMTGKCDICGVPIAAWNKTGMCVKCTHLSRDKQRRGRGGNTNVPKKGARAMIPCYKCKKLFYAKANQHPIYSLCKRCKEENDQIITDQGWINGNNFALGDGGGGINGKP